MANEMASAEILRLHSIIWNELKEAEARIKYEALKNLTEFENIGNEESLKVLKENDITTYEALSTEVIKLEAQMQILEELHMNLNADQEE